MNNEIKWQLIFSVFCVAFLIGLLALLGWMEKKDNDVSQKYYCQMVHEGVQPDYNGTYKQGGCPTSGEVK